MQKLTNFVCFPSWANGPYSPGLVPCAGVISSSGWTAATPPASATPTLTSDTPNLPPHQVHGTQMCTYRILPVELISGIIFRCQNLVPDSGTQAWYGILLTYFGTGFWDLPDLHPLDVGAPLEPPVWSLYLADPSPSRSYKTAADFNANMSASKDILHV